MIYFQQIENENESTKISYTVASGSKMLLHIMISNTFSAPLVIQPSIKLLNPEETETINCTFHPPYNYIPSYEKDKLLCEFDIPKTTLPETKLRYLLSFSSANHCKIEIELIIIETKNNNLGQLYDRNLILDLPLQSEKKPLLEKESKPSISNFYMMSLTKLLKGLEIIETSSSRQFISEIILTLCEIGYKAQQQKEKEEFILKLKRSIFFKNGVLVVAGSQILNWLTISNVISNSYTSKQGGFESKNGLLKQWEHWFTDLFMLDLEREEVNKVNENYSKTVSYQEILNKIDNEPHQFFLYLILGLIDISPKIKRQVEDVCSNIDYNEEKKEQAPQKMFTNIIEEEGSLQI
jgi:hypothetical protein